VDRQRFVKNMRRVMSTRWNKMRKLRTTRKQKEEKAEEGKDMEKRITGEGEGRG
jgi:uncharacterized protein (UPF0305 family)